MLNKVCEYASDCLIVGSRMFVNDRFTEPSAGAPFGAIL